MTSKMAPEHTRREDYTMTEQVLYEKVGRRYRPVSSYDPRVMDGMPAGAHLMLVTPGVRSVRYDVNPAYASVLAAAHIMREPMIDALRAASELRPATQKVTLKQQAAWDAFVKAMGEGVHMATRPGLATVVDAGIAALEKAASESKVDALSADEWMRLRDWMADPARKPANSAFTSGAVRDAATAFESAQALARENAAT